MSNDERSTNANNAKLGHSAFFRHLALGICHSSPWAGEIRGISPGGTRAATAETVDGNSEVLFALVTEYGSVGSGFCAML
jgi:hypothetical protein